MKKHLGWNPWLWVTLSQEWELLFPLKIERGWFMHCRTTKKPPKINKTKQICLFLLMSRFDTFILSFLLYMWKADQIYLGQSKDFHCAARRMLQHQSHKSHDLWKCTEIMSVVKCCIQRSLWDSRYLDKAFVCKKYPFSQSCLNQSSPNTWRLLKTSSCVYVLVEPLVMLLEFFSKKFCLYSKAECGVKLFRLALCTN